LNILRNLWKESFRCFTYSPDKGKGSRNKFLILFLLITTYSFSQTDSVSANPKRKKIISASLGGIYLGSMAGLYQLWYAGYPQSKFHFFNDGTEWLHMDKVGHVYSAYVEGRYSIDMLKWAGYDKRKAAIYGPLYGYLYQSTIELFDGFSSEWGFSVKDVAANTIGTGLVMSQALLWEEQRITMKFSYFPTPFTQKRPELLGTSLLENVFKDYNGQTYWLCVSPHAFNKKGKWPAWLDIAIGYGATGMYGGDDNVWERKGIAYDYSSTPRRMQFYLAPDINLEKLNIKKKWIKYSLRILNTFKFPLPTINLTPGVGFKLQPLMF